MCHHLPRCKVWRPVFERVDGRHRRQAVGASFAVKHLAQGVKRPCGASCIHVTETLERMQCRRLPHLILNAYLVAATAVGFGDSPVASHTEVTKDPCVIIYHVAKSASV